MLLRNSDLPSHTLVPLCVPSSTPSCMLPSDGRSSYVSRRRQGQSARCDRYAIFNWTGTSPTKHILLYQIRILIHSTYGVAYSSPLPRCVCFLHEGDLPATEFAVRRMSYTPYISQRKTLWFHSNDYIK